MTASIVLQRVRDAEQSSKLDSTDVPAVARFAFEAAVDASNSWMIQRTDRESLFQSGVAALSLFYGRDSGVFLSRIEPELKFLRALSVASTGVPVNFEALAQEVKGAEPLGLLGIFNDVYDASEKARAAL